MAIRGGRLTRVANALAFVFTICIGIIAGCVLSTSEAIEEKLTWKKRHAAVKENAGSAVKRGPQ
jgi:hypothetical protein